MKFKSLAVAVSAVVLLAGCDNTDNKTEPKTQAAAASTDSNNQPTAKLETQAEQASYGLGLQIGVNLAAAPIDGMSVEAIALGIQDSLDGKAQRLTNEQIDEALQFAMERAAEKRNALTEAQAEKGREFLAENAKRDGIKTTESGLQYEVLKAKTEGSQPKAEDSVTVHYTGTLVDGSVFDSSVERGQPITFPLTQVIPGWTEGVQLMKVGERFKFYVPAELGYGASSPSPAIPANSTLVFEVELLEIPTQKPATEAQPAQSTEESVELNNSAPAEQ